MTVSDIVVSLDDHRRRHAHDVELAFAEMDRRIAFHTDYLGELIEDCRASVLEFGVESPVGVFHLAYEVLLEGDTSSQVEVMLAEALALLIRKAATK